ncbi:2318_t:CDS:2, partial [Cetraspora pellucida]
MFKISQKSKKKETSKNTDPRVTSGNSEPINHNNSHLTVAINNKTGAALNFIFKRAPNLIPQVISVAKTITPNLPKKSDKNKRTVDNSSINNLSSPASNDSPFLNSPATFTPSQKRGSKSLNGDFENRPDHQRRPSEPTAVLGLNKQTLHSDFSSNNKDVSIYGAVPSSRKKDIGLYGAVPAINVHHVDINNGLRINRSASISNVPIIKEGYLNKKIDFDVKSISSSRGWKAYRVILRGSKLYFYRPPSEAVLKTFFPNNKDMGKDIISTLSPINERGMPLNPLNFDTSASKLIFESNDKFSPPLISKYYYGEICYEVDRTVAMRFKKHVCLLIFEDNVVICKRKWVRYTSANLRPIIDAMGFGGNHSSTNVTSPNINSDSGGQDWDTRSISSTRGIPENDGSSINKGKGYYTKWKLDACYSIHSVDVVPDPNLPTGHSPYITPSSQPPFTANRNDDTSSLRSVSSSVSVIANVSSTSGVILYLNIVDNGEKDSYRVFVASNNDVRSLWIAKLWDAKKANLRKLMKLSDKQSRGLNSDLDNNGLITAYNTRGGLNSPQDSTGIGDEKSEATTVTPRRRAYWSAERHPELIIKESNSVKQSLDNNSLSSPSSPEIETSSQSEIKSSVKIESTSQTLIRGGSIDSLIHELIFETQKGTEENDEFLHAFLLTYPLFAETTHVFRELKRWASAFENDDEQTKKNKICERLMTILTTWCQNYGRDLARDDIRNAMLELVDEAFANNPSNAEEIKKLIQDSRANVLNVDINEEEMTVNETLCHSVPAPLSLDLSNLLVTGLTPALFLKMVPEELAQQIYLYHFLEFYKTNPMKDLRIFSPSKKSSGVTTERNRRPLILTHWIQTGIACKMLGDMPGWMAVASAICSPGIVRLKETWRRVNERWKDVVVNEWIPLLLSFGGIDGEADIENANSLLLVIQDKKEKSKTKPIPYFGFITIALDRVNSTIPSVIDRSTNDQSRTGSRNNSISGSSIINFEKYRKMYDTIIYSLNQWEQAESYIKFDENSCPFTPSSPLQKYFHQLNSVPTSSTLDVWQLFDSSLICEPRLHGQYLEHHARQHKSHSAYVPLVFTEVIPSSRLFEKNAVLSASGTLGKKTSNSSLNIGSDNNSLVSMASPTRQSFSSSYVNADTYPTSPINKTQFTNNSPAHQIYGGVRQRTISFPPSKIGPITSTTWNTGLDLFTRNWLGGLAQHRGSYTVLLKCMKDIAGVGEMLMFVKDGELVFKSVRDATGSRPASLVESGTTSKRNSIHGITHPQQNSPRTSLCTYGEHDSLMVVVKAGTLERLVDVLINGVASFSTSVVDDNGEPPLTIGKQGQLGINSAEYLATFFSTYRSFCSPNVLFEILRKHFANAKKNSKKSVESTASVTFGNENETKQDGTSYDWNQVITIQSKVLKVFQYWVDEFFYDFLDDLTLRNRLSHILNDAKSEIEELTGNSDNEQLLSHAKETKETIINLKRSIMVKSLEPANDAQNEKMSSLIDKVINDPSSLPSSRNNNITKDVEIHTPSSDAQDVSDLLDSIDLTVIGLFEAVTPQDWVLAFEILETQSINVLGWYPKKQSSTSDEEIHITDIFTVLQQTERTGNSKRSVLSSLPRSIQALCRVHSAIRKWAIQEIVSTTIDLERRVNRINIFLDMILLSRKRMAKLDIYPKDEIAKPESEAKRGVPSLVESAIVSALISPESRLFAKAWNEISITRDGGLESLESLLQSGSTKRHLTIHVQHNLALVPCIGWLFERMLEICCNVPDISFDTEKLINYDKRRYLYNLTQIFVRLQRELSERAQDRTPVIDFSDLISISQKSNAKTHFRFLKEVASRENNMIRVSNAPPKQPKLQRPFYKLIAEQQEKVKRDQKEKERLAKDIRETQNKLQKKQNEQAKLLEKQTRIQQRPRNKSRVESFIKHAVRPFSMVLANTWQSTIHSGNTSSSLKAQNANPKPTLVINLINSMTSVDYDAMFDFVFRVESEEGGQYLFQALDYDNMNEWIRVINDAAKEGAEKRRTIFQSEQAIEPKEEVVPEETKTRSSVYGKELFTLMADGKVPLLVEKCIAEIEKRGLEEVGIYRVPGIAGSVNKLRATFNTNAEAVNLNEEEYRDINVIAGALKLFFRSLPEPLTTFELYDEFIQAA